MSPEIERPPPPYMQVAGHLRDQIVRGELQPGEPVPSVRQLAAQWGVSRGTTEKALNWLRTEGLIVAQQGVGAVVRSQVPVYRRVEDRYATARRTGRIYTKGEYARILTAELVESPTEVAEALGVVLGSQVVRRHRVTYLADHTPVASSTTWFDGAIAEAAPALLNTDRIREGTATYVESVTGRVLRFGEERLSARLATTEELREFQQTGPQAVLETRHVGYDADGTPFTYEVGVAPANYWTSYTYEVPAPSTAQESPS